MNNLFIQSIFDELLRHLRRKDIMSVTAGSSLDLSWNLPRADKQRFFSLGKAGGSRQ